MLRIKGIVGRYTTSHICKDTFSKCLKVGEVTDEEDHRLIQGIIPDMILDVRGQSYGGTYPDNPLDDRVSLFVTKPMRA